MNDRTENVAVVGASPKDERYSNMAMRMLAEYGRNPIPVAPARKEVIGKTAYPSLADVPEKIDTVTVYIRASRQSQMIADIIQIKPRRVIFNPGAENPDEYARLRNLGIEVLEACTLVMLHTGQF